MDHKWEFFDINWMGPEGSCWIEQCLVCGTERTVEQVKIGPFKVLKCENEECSGVQVQVRRSALELETLMQEAENQGVRVIIPDFVKPRRE